MLSHAGAPHTHTSNELNFSVVHVPQDILFKAAHLSFPCLQGIIHPSVYVLACACVVGRVKGFPDLSLSFDGNICLPDVTAPYERQLGISVDLLNGNDLNS